MLGDNNHIDQLFRDKLVGFDQHPPEAVWSNIQAAIGSQPVRKTWLWWRIAGVAAAVFLALVAGWMLVKFPVEQLEPLVEGSSASKLEVPAGQPVNEVYIAETSPGTVGQAPVSSPISEGMKTALPHKVASEETPLIVVGEHPATWYTENSRQFIPLEARDPVILLNDEGDAVLAKLGEWLGAFESRLATALLGDEQTEPGLSLKDQLIVAENIRQRKQQFAKEDTGNQWGIGALASALASGEQNKGGDRDFFASNYLMPDTRSETTFSGGMMVDYKVTERLKVKSGVVYSKLKHRTDGLVMSMNFGGDGYVTEDSGMKIAHASLTAITPTGQVHFSEMPELAISTHDAIFGTSAELDGVLVTTADLAQDMEYIEVPVILAYSIIDRKVNLDLSGGVSANFLVGNSARIYEESQRTQVGETADLRDMVYSGSLGVSVGVDLSRRLKLSIEPRMKYFLSSVSKNSAIDYKPYQFGVYTGITYSFN